MCKSKSLTAILNPRARHGRAGRAYESLLRLFDRAGIEGSVLQTEGPGHATELAREAAAHSDIVAAIGGDGTIHEVANGIIESRQSAALGVVPLGTGNDYVKMTGTPLNLEEAVDILAAGKRKTVDYGALSYSTDDRDGLRYFVNTAGIGFDGEVGLRAPSYKALPGFAAYLASLAGALRHIVISDAHIDVEGSDGASSFFRGPLLLCTFGNGQYSGGIFRLTPEAAIDDGWLDVGVIEQMSIRRILRSVPRVVRGTHTDMAEFHTIRARSVSMQVAPGLPVHLDGEVVAARVRRLEVRLVEGGLDVVAP